ncbi:MAG: OmpA family protein [Nitrosomonadales bacterium]|nr:OmpA family protein [Nitrosomonadales bacterium]
MKRILLSSLLLALAGCTSTTAILLPDADGKVGALVLKQGKTEQVVDHPYTAAQGVAVGDGISLHQRSKEAVEQQYAATLNAQPAAAASFILYFQEGSVELTDESRALLPAVVVSYKAHAPARVVIIGHTDRTGSNDLNMKLSLERAQLVEQMLRATSTDFDQIEVSSFGENDPLIHTADGVAEPRNRRVEIVIL